MKLLIPLILVGTMGCTRQAPAGRPLAQRGDTVVGEVQVVGSAPVDVRVVIRDDAGKTVTLAGPVLGELAKLAGARVATHGDLDRQRMIVQSYEVVSVDGAPVHMGVVERNAAGGLQLRERDGTLVALTGGTSSLRPGQKVWVQGQAAVQVQTFGVVRP